MCYQPRLNQCAGMQVEGSKHCTSLYKHAPAHTATPCITYRSHVHKMMANYTPLVKKSLQKLVLQLVIHALSATHAALPCSRAQRWCLGPVGGNCLLQPAGKSLYGQLYRHNCNEQLQMQPCDRATARGPAAQGARAFAAAKDALACALTAHFQKHFSEAPFRMTQHCRNAGRPPTVNICVPYG